MHGYIVVVSLEEDPSRLIDMIQHVWLIRKQYITADSVNIVVIYLEEGPNRKVSDIAR